MTHPKPPEYLDLDGELCVERKLDGVPHSIVCTDLCRPALLGKMGAVAVIPVAPAASLTQSATFGDAYGATDTSS